jgi:hypothetical protein
VKTVISKNIETAGNETATIFYQNLSKTATTVGGFLGRCQVLADVQ